MKQILLTFYISDAFIKCDLICTKGVHSFVTDYTYYKEKKEIFSFVNLKVHFRQLKTHAGYRPGFRL